MASDCLPQALLVGEAQTGKASLASRLCSNCTSDRADQSSDLWQIATKYYQASAKIVCFSLDGPDLAVSIPSSGGPVEAVVLFLDCTRHQSFLTVKEWFQGPGSKICEAADVCLCIANKVRPHFLSKSPDQGLLPFLK